jgi:transposase
MEWTVAVGVDTHKDVHVCVALDRLGRELDRSSFPATEAGYGRCLAWACSLGEPAFAIEGCGSFGAGLARVLAGAGLPVWEAERPRRAERRRGKSDTLDALRAARRLLADGEGLSELRTLPGREALRVLLLERRSSVQARTQALNQLHALALTAPSCLRERLETLAGERLAEAAARLRPAAGAATDERVLVEVIRRLGRRAQALTQELAAVDARIAELVRALAAELLAEPGVGPVCAAQLLVSSGDPARLRSEASFAALAGTSPVEASSGRQQRHRLNRGGDRRLNEALHVIALNRIRHHPETAAYHARLLERGKTRREARRCVKRVLARHFYRRLCLILA